MIGQTVILPINPDPSAVAAELAKAKAELEALSDCSLCAFTTVEHLPHGPLPVFDDPQLVFEGPAASTDYLPAGTKIMKIEELEISWYLTMVRFTRVDESELDNSEVCGRAVL